MRVDYFPADFRPLSRFQRGLVMALGIVLPCLCLGVAWLPTFLGPESQMYFVSGVASLLFSSISVVWVAPFLIYAMLSLALVIHNQDRYGRYFVARAGVYSGVVIGGTYSLLLAGRIAGRLGLRLAVAIALEILVVWLAARLGGLMFAWLQRKWTTYHYSLASRSRYLPQVVMGALLFYPALVATFVAAPVWITATYLAMGRRLFYRYGGYGKVDLRESIGIVTWAAAYMAAWRLATLDALKTYAMLPAGDPKCYVATAAAAGHPWLVGSEEIKIGSQRRVHVNQQLRYLKCGELALAAVSPKAHRLLRAIYDQVGPPVARRLSHPLLADAAYLSLKPAEWLARAALGWALDDFERLAARVYRSPQAPNDDDPRIHGSRCAGLTDRSG